MKNLTFNISETAQITGLSIDTLRYYDKIDLIKSKKNVNNRYRYYTIEDISLINHIKNLRDLDLSINDIRTLLHSSTEVQQNILQNHHKVLLEKVASMKKIEKLFKATMEEANSTNLLINIPVIKAYKDRYFLELKTPTKPNKCAISKKHLLDSSDKFSKIIDKFIFPIQNRDFSSKFLFDFLESGSIDCNELYYTEITKEKAEELEDQSKIIFVPKSFYIETITKLSKDTFDEYYQNLIDWIDYKNLKPIYPGFVKYIDASLYFINKGEYLVKFEIPFQHKRYE